MIRSPYQPYQQAIQSTPQTMNAARFSPFQQARPQVPQFTAYRQPQFEFRYPYRFPGSPGVVYGQVEQTATPPPAASPVKQEEKEIKPKHGSKPRRTITRRRTGQTKPTSRTDNSLIKLTKRFIELIKESEGGILDLNDAKTQMEVRKRRIYDITNVLEGIDLIEKLKKSRIQWKGEHLTSQSEVSEIKMRKKDLKRLDSEEEHLDGLIEEMNVEMDDLIESEDARNHLAISIRDLETVTEFHDKIQLIVPEHVKCEADVDKSDVAPDAMNYTMTTETEPIDLLVMHQSRTKLLNDSFISLEEMKKSLADIADKGSDQNENHNINRIIDAERGDDVLYNDGNLVPFLGDSNYFLGNMYSSSGLSEDYMDSSVSLLASDEIDDLGSLY